jgi:hypothetical protein
MPTGGETPKRSYCSVFLFLAFAIYSKFAISLRLTGLVEQMAFCCKYLISMSEQILDKETSFCPTRESSFRIFLTAVNCSSNHNTRVHLALIQSQEGSSVVVLIDLGRLSIRLSSLVAFTPKLCHQDCECCARRPVCLLHRTLLQRAMKKNIPTNWSRLSLLLCSNPDSLASLDCVLHPLGSMINSGPLKRLPQMLFTDANNLTYKILIVRSLVVEEQKERS